MHQEPTSKSQGPRDQPTILQYSGLPPTDFLKQILIMQKMHAPNIFFAKIPQCGRLHACLTPSKNIPIVYTDLCNVWSGSSSCLHGNTMKPNVQAVGYIYIYMATQAERSSSWLKNGGAAKRQWTNCNSCSKTFQVLTFNEPNKSWTFLMCVVNPKHSPLGTILGKVYIAWCKGVVTKTMKM